MEAQRVTNAGAQILNGVRHGYGARARLAAEAALPHAAAVDADARFPSEAFAEISKQRLLGMMVPQALGGEGATLRGARRRVLHSRPGLLVQPR